MVGVRAEKRASLEDMKAYTAEQIRTAEAPLIAAGVPLMQRAAHALAEVISRELTATGVRDRILILAGPGSNGGDALFAGAELAARGHGVDILPVSSRIHEPGFQAAQEAGAQVLADLGSAALDIVAAATAAAPRAAVIVDGILGTGSAGRAALRGSAREVVAALRDQDSGGSRPVVVAVDIPSGLDADRGTTDGIVLPAAVTVTCGACKVGLLTGEGPQLAGRIEVIDIGLGPALAKLAPSLES